MTSVFVTTDPTGEDRAVRRLRRFRRSVGCAVVAGENDTLSNGGGGDDVLVAEGNSTLRGGDGNDLVAGQQAFGDAGDDIIFSTSFAAGGEGNDIIGMF